MTDQKDDLQGFPKPSAKQRETSDPHPAEALDDRSSENKVLEALKALGDDMLKEPVPKRLSDILNRRKRP